MKKLAIIFAFIFMALTGRAQTAMDVTTMISMDFISQGYSVEELVSDGETECILILGKPGLTKNVAFYDVDLVMVFQGMDVVFPWHKEDGIYIQTGIHEETLFGYFIGFGYDKKTNKLIVSLSMLEILQ